MHLFSLLLGLLFALVIAASEVDIVSTYIPDECAFKAQKGDTLLVHYVRRPCRMELNIAHLILSSDGQALQQRECI